MTDDSSESGVKFRDFLTLPPALISATTRQLAARYFVLADRQITLQIRAGYRPSSVDNPALVEPSGAKREVLRASLQSIVREMIAIQYEINKRPNALLSGVPLALWRVVE